MIFFFLIQCFRKKLPLGSFLGVWYLRSTGSGLLEALDMGLLMNLSMLLIQLLMCVLDDGLNISFCGWILRYSEDRFF